VNREWTDWIWILVLTFTSVQSGLIHSLVQGFLPVFIDESVFSSLPFLLLHRSLSFKIYWFVYRSHSPPPVALNSYDFGGLNYVRI
jgi:hypothetical protein